MQQKNIKLLATAAGLSQVIHWYDFHTILARGLLETAL
jgi:hypothetical protein